MALARLRFFCRTLPPFHGSECSDQDAQIAMSVGLQITDGHTTETAVALTARAFDLPIGEILEALTRAQPKKAPIDYWESTGVDYLKALAETPYGVRALTMNRCGIDLGDEESPWHPVARLFVADIDEKYVNIVCGDDGEVRAFYTLGVPNIAITGVRKEPTPIEAKYLEHYDAVITPTNEDAAALRKMGINAQYVPPVEAELTPLLARFIHA